MRKRSILVSLDFSDATDAVLEHARRLARAYNAQIRLIHVGRDSHKTGGMEFELPDHVRLLQAQHQMERARLARYAKTLDQQGFHTEANFAEGNAGRAILEAAHRLNPAAIVIGAHAHSALHGMLLHGVKRSLFNEGEWPILVVPVGRTRGRR